MTRKKILELDGYKCRSFGCGAISNLQVHHIIPKSQSNYETAWNKITLCSSCHKKVTDGIITNHKMLLALLKSNTPGFRWQRAFIWHQNREELKKLKRNK